MHTFSQVVRGEFRAGSKHRCDYAHILSDGQSTARSTKCDYAHILYWQCAGMCDYAHILSGGQSPSNQKVKLIMDRCDYAHILSGGQSRFSAAACDYAHILSGGQRAPLASPFCIRICEWFFEQPPKTTISNSSTPTIAKPNLFPHKSLKQSSNPHP